MHTDHKTSCIRAVFLRGHLHSHLTPPAEHWAQQWARTHTRTPRVQSQQVPGRTVLVSKMGRRYPPHGEITKCTLLSPMRKGWGTLTRGLEAPALSPRNPTYTSGYNSHQSLSTSCQCHLRATQLSTSQTPAMMSRDGVTSPVMAPTHLIWQAAQTVYKFPSEMKITASRNLKNFSSECRLPLDRLIPKAGLSLSLVCLPMEKQCKHNSEIHAK